jgi:hypothetical protein
MALVIGPQLMPRRCPPGQVPWSGWVWDPVLKKNVYRTGCGLMAPPPREPMRVDASAVAARLSGLGAIEAAARRAMPSFVQRQQREYLQFLSTKHITRFVVYTDNDYWVPRRYFETFDEAYAQARSYLHGTWRARVEWVSIGGCYGTPCTSFNVRLCSWRKDPLTGNVSHASGTQFQDQCRYAGKEYA